jgi:hypothetical protein
MGHDRQARLKRRTRLKSVTAQLHRPIRNSSELRSTRFRQWCGSGSGGVLSLAVPRCFQWNTPETKLLGELASYVATSPKNVVTLVATLASKITRFYRHCCNVATSQGDYTQIRPRPRFLATGSSNLKPKIDLKLLPIPGLTFCTPQNLKFSA